MDRKRKVGIGASWQAKNQKTLNTHMKKQKHKLIFTSTPQGVLNSTQAAEVGSELQIIEAKHGAIKPEIVVEEATPKRSPLHKYFTWDNSEAAVQWRLEEARRIVRSVRIIHDDSPAAEQPIIRAFVSVKASDEDRFDGTGYVSMTRAMSVGFYHDQVLAAAKNELEQWRRRYADLKEFGLLYQAIDEALEVA